MSMHHGRPQRPTSHRAEIAQLHREPFASAGSPAPAAPSRRASRPHAPDNPEEMSTEEYYRELFAQAQAGTLEEPGAPARPARPQPVNPDNPEEISTEEFYRQIFAQARGEASQKQAPEPPARPAPAPRPAAASGGSEEMSTEDFYRELFAQAQGKTTQPQPLGPRSGLEPPALPARFRRVRGGNALVSYELLVADDGRIAAKHESVAGRETYFIYEYDESGHLLRAWRDGRLAEEYAYDPRGARVASWSAKDGQRKYGYDQRGRLTAAGPWQFSYAADGGLREAWTPQAAYFLSYSPAGGMSRVVLPGNRVLRCETMPPGLPTEKYVDARPVESLTWRSPLQLATYRDRDRGVTMQFHYTGQGRLPSAVTVQTPQGAANYLLGYDQVGSVKAVAAMDGPNEGRVVKTIDYDSFGNLLTDSNPGLFLPLAFAGGLRDRFTGLVRFLHRDYDPTTGRFTAPDPLGDTGGDHDPYDYCVDEPVGRVDPEGLEGEAAVASGGFFSGIGDWFGSLGDKISGMIESDTPPASETEADVLKKMDTVSRDVDSALGKAKEAIKSVRPELDDIAKGAGISDKITLPQEARDEAIRIGNKIDATKSRTDYLLKEMSQDNATAAHELQENGLPEHRKNLLETPGEFLCFMWDKFSPIPAPPKPKDGDR